MFKYSDAELNVLQKFINWSVVSDEDENILYRYGEIGFVHFGFDWDKMDELAKLTELGLGHL